MLRPDMIRALVHNHFSDASCGFKAMRQETAQVLLPLVADNALFFDTELLLLAERNGLRIHEVPVDWVDTESVSRCQTPPPPISKDSVASYEFWERGWIPSRSRPVSEARQFLPIGPIARVGLFTTLSYFALFFLLTPFLGVYAANVVVLAICTATNIAAHGRFTFVTHGPIRLDVVLLGWVVIFTTNVLLTTLGLVVASWVAPGALLARVIAILIGTGMAALASTLQTWIFRRHEGWPPSRLCH